MPHWEGWSFDKFHAANVSSAPYDVTMPRGPEAIEREIKFEGGDVRGRAAKCGSFVAQMFDRARINAADTCNAKQCKLVDLNALLSSTFDHLHACLNSTGNRDGATNNRSTLV
jgi:hypothetical protein